MGDFAELEVNGRTILRWKYNDLPVLLLFIMEPGDQVVEREPPNLAGTEDDDEIPEDLALLRFTTNVRSAKTRLAAKGLTYSRVLRMAAQAMRTTPGNLENEMAGDVQQFSSAQNNDPLREFRVEKIPIVETLDYSGYLELHDLLMLWRALRGAKEDDPVTIDLAQMWHFDKPEEAETWDFHSFAREDLARRVQILNSIYDFSRRASPEAIEFVDKQMGSMAEKAFVKKAVIPFLEAEGYEGARAIRFDGPEEFGNDTSVFRKLLSGKLYYYGAQAKAKRVNQSDVPQLRSQIEAALTVSFFDDADNHPKRLDGVLIFLAKGMTSQAQRVLFGKPFTGSVRKYESRELAKFLVEHGLQGSLP